MPPTAIHTLNNWKTVQMLSSFELRGTQAESTCAGGCPLLRPMPRRLRCAQREYQVDFHQYCNNHGNCAICLELSFSSVMIEQTTSRGKPAATAYFAELSASTPLSIPHPSIPSIIVSKPAAPNAIPDSLALLQWLIRLGGKKKKETPQPPPG